MGILGQPRTASSPSADCKQSVRGLQAVRPRTAQSVRGSRSPSRRTAAVSTVTSATSCASSPLECSGDFRHGLIDVLLTLRRITVCPLFVVMPNKVMHRSDIGMTAFIAIRRRLLHQIEQAPQHTIICDQSDAPLSVRQHLGPVKGKDGLARTWRPYNEQRSVKRVFQYVELVRLASDRSRSRSEVARQCSQS